MRIIDTLLEQPVSSQISFLLLRKSLQLRTAHLPRCVVWEQVDAAMQRVATKVRDATCDILDLDIGEDPSACLPTLQMSLPERCGGLGVLTHTETTSRSAYLYAAALTDKSVQKGDTALLSFSGPSGYQMQDTYAVLQSADCELPALTRWWIPFQGYTGQESA